MHGRELKWVEEVQLMLCCRRWPYLLSLILNVACLPEPQDATKIDVITINICGSSTMGGRLLPRLIYRWQGKAEPSSDAHMMYKQNIPIEFDLKSGRKMRFLISYSNSNDSIDLIKKKKCKLGMHSGALTELQLIESLPAYLVGKDAIAIIGSEKFRRQKLTVSELRDLYSGQGDLDMRVITRKSSKSGTSSAFKALLGVTKLRGTSGDEMDTREISSILSSDDFSRSKTIVYLSLQELLNTNQDFHVIGIFNKKQKSYFTPSIPSINQDSYPLIRYLHLLTAQNAQETRSENVVKGTEDYIKQFIHWVQTSSAARDEFEILKMVRSSPYHSHRQLN